MGFSAAALNAIVGWRFVFLMYLYELYFGQAYCCGTESRGSG